MGIAPVAPRCFDSWGNGKESGRADQVGLWSFMDGMAELAVRFPIEVGGSSWVWRG
jgi:hypothetical protein